ncbi:hypothetical protein ACFL6U_21695 [Planctomycetota bacterium]
MISSKPIFVVSDLHIGNGSSLDQFQRAGAEPLFLQFLDYVSNQEGRLIIAGDLLELWRFPVTEVVDYRFRLLDRLSQVNPVYIPGNHDAGIAHTHQSRLHPLFQHIQSPFTAVIGDRRFRFMHGHEQDPFIKNRLYRRTLPGCLSSAFSLKDKMCRRTGDTIPDLVLEGSEYLLSLYHGLRRDPRHRIHPALRRNRKQYQRRSGYSVRTQKMLSRYHHDKDNSSYDVAVVGHSHRVGQYNNWYFNSGCWIGATHSFLKIWPDGHVEVFDWDQRIPRSNKTRVWNGSADRN